MGTTIGEVVSRLRNTIKAVKQDAFMTDRLLYSLFVKHSRWIMKREDSSNKIMKQNSLFQSLNYVELVEVDRIESQCACVKTGCKVMRTKNKIPKMIDGYWGPLVRTITSIDRSTTLSPTFPSIFEKMSQQKTFKYNTKKYYWFLDGHLYFPNIEWDAVRIEGVFEDDISEYNCEGILQCVSMQNKSVSIPESLFAEIESNVVKDLSVMLGITPDMQHDNKHIARS
jgi:hypothetical protein